MDHPAAMFQLSYSWKQCKKEPVWPFFCCCTADLQTDSGRHQLYNNQRLACSFFHCCLILTGDADDGEDDGAHRRERRLGARERDQHGLCIPVGLEGGGRRRGRLGSEGGGGGGGGGGEGVVLHVPDVRVLHLVDHKDIVNTVWPAYMDDGYKVFSSPVIGSARLYG